MVGSNGTMIAIRLVRSKLRKREEHSNSVHPAEVVLQTTTTTTTLAPSSDATNQCQVVVNNNIQNCAPQALQNDPLAYRGQFLWQQPPPPIQQQYLYNKDQDMLVQNLPTERPGFVRGFRKNLGGRWRRLVKRKPPTEVYTIPAELKPQLKQIYVY